MEILLNGCGICRIKENKMESQTSPTTILVPTAEGTACHLHVGTSGYSYAEWVEAGFYPSGTASNRMLSIYSQAFNITELNYTWYQMPKAPSIERMLKKAPDDFQFTAKLTRTMTHEVEASQWRGQAARYRDGLAPLIQSRQIAAVLVQLPPYFSRSTENRRYLAALLDELADLPLAVEFRHASWATQRVFDGLCQRRVAIVAVDEPHLPGLFPALETVTSSDFLYLRFHGRNAKGWRSGNMQQQFDYDYTDEELRQWTRTKLPNMCAKAKKGYIFFNNHVRAQAPKNAKQLIELIKGA
jgi:uncharacterized protein YecE (DUF72 family)